ncbi:KR domain-containing protein [Nocardia sp. XZ_19_385]|uniref:KR domain-containing protein n=1 Tax=Nocardia sp. XZ_19_385 TaxID=2769488 RepID=UPI00188EA0DB|nr:KR domain-containing protein [Nocardia sp. XZ_19_385]
MTTPLTNPPAEPRHPVNGTAAAQPEFAPPILGVATQPRLDRLEWPCLLDARHEYMLGHLFAGRPVLSGAAYLELWHAAAKELSGADEITLRDIRFRQMLPLSGLGTGTVTLRIVAQAEQHAWRFLAVGPDESVLAQARTEDDPPALEPPVLAEARSRCIRWQAGGRFYNQHYLAGNQWVGAFRRIAEMWFGPGETVARIRGASAGHTTLPALDACLQTVFTLLPTAADSPMMLTAIDRVRFRNTPLHPQWCLTRAVRNDDSGFAGDITVYDGNGTAIAELSGVRVGAVRVRRAAPPPPARETPLRSLPFHPRSGSPAREAELHPLQRGSATSMAEFRTAWQTVELGSPEREDRGRVLIRQSGTALDAAVIAELRNAGHTVFPVAAHADADAIRADLGPDRPLHAVLNMAALGSVTHTNSSARQVLSTAVGLCAGALATAQATPAGAPTILVTRGARAAGPDPRCSAPWQAALWGLGPVLSREQQREVILVDLPESGESLATEAARLTAVARAAATETRLALRRGRWWVPRLVPLDTAYRADPDAICGGIRPGVTYVITGGLTGAGEHCAQWLVDRGARSLLVIGATEVESAVPQRLRGSGVVVEQHVADIANEHAVARILASAERRSMPIAGVVHAAVQPEHCHPDPTPAQLEHALRAKVAGAWTLHRLLSARPLDFFVLLSPATTRQLGADAASNAFLDALADHRRAAGLPATVVNWSIAGDPTPAPPTSAHLDLENYLLDQVARMLGAAVGSLDRHGSLIQLGLSSLHAVDLAHRLREDHGIELTLSDVLDAASVAELALRLLMGTLA